MTKLTKNELLLFRMSLALASAVLEVETIAAAIVRGSNDTDMVDTVTESRTKLRKHMADFMTTMRTFNPENPDV